MSSKASSGSGQRNSAQEISAGGVVVRGAEIAVIVPKRRGADGQRVLALPKGHLNPGESALQAAKREVREETGIVGEPIYELGEVRYWYRRDGLAIDKSVSFFLFRYLEGDVGDHDDEVEEARWIPLTEAGTALSYPTEREMVERTLAYLEQNGTKDR
jgi:8-oxo-dGTP pyrophosphatase MutT (NUDIX family)